MNDNYDRLISKKEVCKLLSVAPATIDRWNNQSDPCYRAEFPRRRQLGFRVLWSEREVQAFINLVLAGSVK